MFRYQELRVDRRTIHKHPKLLQPPSRRFGIKRRLQVVTNDDGLAQKSRRHALCRAAMRYSPGQLLQDLVCAERLVHAVTQLLRVQWKRVEAVAQVKLMVQQLPRAERHGSACRGAQGGTRPGVERVRVSG